MQDDTAKWIRNRSDEIAIEHGCHFDLTSAERVRTFFEKYLRHYKGKQSGQPFCLLDWQWTDFIAPLFGWRRADGTRRYREAYVEVAKKNGKSTICGALGLYLLVADEERSAEVYAAAADVYQARIVHGTAEKLVKHSPALRTRCLVTPSQKIIAYPRTDSVFRALSADAHTKEGLDAHGVIFDELHAQPDRRLWRTLYYAGAARRQPLLLSITTAGDDKESVCWERHEYAEKVRTGVIEDWEFFGLIYAAGKDDDWTDPRVWRKANPSMDVTVKATDFQRACATAKSSPAFENEFKRYRLNIWTEQTERLIAMAKWDACVTESDPVKWRRNTLERLKGQPCHIGVDLASTEDMACICQIFQDGDTITAIPWYFVPEARAAEREQTGRLPSYRAWARQGFLDLTPGNVIDQERIENRIRAIQADTPVAGIAYDDWNSTRFATNLQADSFDLRAFQQTTKNYNEPMKRMLALILAGKLNHGANPILRWNAANLAAYRDANENLRPSKKSSGDKIDGICAMLMGLALTMQADIPSVYSQREAVFL